MGFCIRRLSRQQEQMSVNAVVTADPGEPGVDDAAHISDDKCTERNTGGEM